MEPPSADECGKQEQGGQIQLLACSLVQKGVQQKPLRCRSADISLVYLPSRLHLRTTKATCLTPSIEFSAQRRHQCTADRTSAAPERTKSQFHRGAGTKEMRCGFTSCHRFSPMGTMMKESATTQPTFPRHPRCGLTFHGEERGRVFNQQLIFTPRGRAFLMTLVLALMYERFYQN